MPPDINTDAEPLTAALCASATDPAERAAVTILTGLPHKLFARPDIRAHFYEECEGPIRVAVVGWSGLYRDIIAGQVPLSRGERRMLLVACSMATVGLPVSLAELLTGLDAPNTALLVTAVQQMLGGDQ